jgi:hypothetical protein
MHRVSWQCFQDFLSPYLFLPLFFLFIVIAFQFQLFFGSIAAGSPLRFGTSPLNISFLNFYCSGALDQFLKWLWAYYFIASKYSSPHLPVPVTSTPVLSPSLPIPSHSLSQSQHPQPSLSTQSRPLALPSLSHLIQSPIQSKRKAQSARSSGRWMEVVEPKEFWVCCCEILACIFVTYFFRR